MIARYALTIAALFAFVLTGMSGLIVVPFLHKLHYGQTIKEIGPTWHKNKQGTPTMGGICFIFGSTLGLGLAWLYLGMKQSDLMGSHEAFNVILALSAAWLFGSMAKGSGFAISAAMSAAVCRVLFLMLPAPQGMYFSPLPCG